MRYALALDPLWPSLPICSPILLDVIMLDCFCILWLFCNKQPYVLVYWQSFLVSNYLCCFVQSLYNSEWSCFAGVSMFCSFICPPEQMHFIHYSLLTFPEWTVTCTFVFVLFQIARKFSGITEFNMPFHQWHFFTSTSRQHWKVSVFSPLLCIFQLRSSFFMYSPFFRPDNLTLCLQYLEGYFYDIKRVWSMMTFSDDLMWNLISVGNWCRQSVFEMNWLHLLYPP